MPQQIKYSIAAIFLILIGNVKAQQIAKPVMIQVDLGKKTNEPLKPIWAWFGYDEPNYTYMKDGKKLLSELAELSPVPVFVRAHNLLTTNGIFFKEGNSFTVFIASRMLRICVPTFIITLPSTNFGCPFA